MPWTEELEALASAGSGTIRKTIGLASPGKASLAVFSGFVAFKMPRLIRVVYMTFSSDMSDCEILQRSLFRGHHGGHMTSVESGHTDPQVCLSLLIFLHSAA